MEINLLIRIKNLQELKDWVEMMEVFPTIGKGLKINRNIAALSEKAQGLRNEIKELEQQKSSSTT